MTEKHINANQWNELGNRASSTLDRGSTHEVSIVYGDQPHSAKETQLTLVRESNGELILYDGAQNRYRWDDFPARHKIFGINFCSSQRRLLGTFIPSSDSDAQADRHSRLLMEESVSDFNFQRIAALKDFQDKKLRLDQLEQQLISDSARQHRQHLASQRSIEAQQQMLDLDRKQHESESKREQDLLARQRERLAALEEDISERHRVVREKEAQLEQARRENEEVRSRAENMHKDALESTQRSNLTGAALTAHFKKVMDTVSAQHADLLQRQARLSQQESELAVQKRELELTKKTQSETAEDLKARESTVARLSEALKTFATRGTRLNVTSTPKKAITFAEDEVEGRTRRGGRIGVGLTDGARDDDVTDRELYGGTGVGVSKNALNAYGGGGRHDEDENDSQEGDETPSDSDDDELDMSQLYLVDTWSHSVSPKTVPLLLSEVRFKFFPASVQENPIALSMWELFEEWVHLVAELRGKTSVCNKLGQLLLNQLRVFVIGQRDRSADTKAIRRQLAAAADPQDPVLAAFNSVARKQKTSSARGNSRPPSRSSSAPRQRSTGRGEQKRPYYNSKKNGRRGAAK